MASTYLSRTPSSTGNRKTWTISGWIKRCETSTSSLQIFSAGEYAVTDLVQIYTSSHKLYCGMYNSSGTEISSLITSRLFRDTNAFYHIVVAVDTTQATASNRVKIYINGVQETAFDTENYPTQNYDTAFNTTNQNTIGSVKGNTQYFDGIMSHVHLIDGTAYDASAFGEYDANGVWTIKTSPSVTYGNNGFFILKDGNSVTDQSGNGNNFTVGGGTLTNTEDNPSNVFATLNPLSLYPSTGALSNANNTYASTSANMDFSVSTLGMNSGSGKFYCEVKISSSSSYNMIGISDHSYQGSNQELSEDNYSYAYYSDSSVGETGGAVRSNAIGILTGMPNYGVNDIIGIAVDLENHKLYFHKNGTWINSGDPTSGATGTGAVSINDLNATPNTDSRGQGVYFFGCGDWHTSSGGTYQFNFGNGYFGTTAVASAGTNASGIGIFEFDVPTGYTALSTKGLNL